MMSVVDCIHWLLLPQANKMVLGSAPFRLASVIEAAMEIVGLQAATKRLQVCCACSLHAPRFAENPEWACLLFQKPH